MKRRDVVVFLIATVVTLAVFGSFIALWLASRDVP